LIDSAFAGHSLHCRLLAHRRRELPFQAFSLGPANVVVPIYGMLIVGGALLGVVALDEPIDLAKSR
jgi:hypothetical protein